MNGQSVGEVALLALGGLFKQLFPHKQKVKEYLDKSTRESILQDLQRLLTQELRRVQPPPPSTVFDTYSVKDSEHQYWNEDSFRRYVRRAYADDSISEPAIQLLWRSFHHYAYHPFPQDPIDGRIDSNSFERAVLLLVHQSNDLLGTQESDYFWRNDDDFFRKASFKRLFRSIGHLISSSEKSFQSDFDSAPMVNDIMDVLSMTQPQPGMPDLPSPDQLEPAAGKLFGNGPSQYQTSRKDLSILLSLLIRLRLQKDEWGLLLPFGTFDKAETGDKQLADVLLNEIGGGQGEGDIITSDQVLQILDLLPNLHLRFYQLWSAIFQPSTPAVDEALSQTSDPMLGHIMGVISLFVPQAASRCRYRERIMMTDTQISFKSLQSTQGSDDITVSRFIKSLAKDPHPYVVLFTSGENTATMPVVGAYFPGPLWMEDKEGGEEHKHEYRTSTPTLLFQLQPEFRLFQSTTTPNRPLKGNLHVDGNTLSLEAIAASDDTIPELSMPYWIGDPERKGVELCVEPQMKSVTLKSNSTDLNTNEGGCRYKQVGTDGRSVNKWVVTVEHAQLHIFSVSGGLIKDVGIPPPMAEDLSKYKQNPILPKIEGEALKKRIEGFGSV